MIAVANNPPRTVTRSVAGESICGVPGRLHRRLMSGAAVLSVLVLAGCNSATGIGERMRQPQGVTESLALEQAIGDAGQRSLSASAHPEEANRRAHMSVIASSPRTAGVRPVIEPGDGQFISTQKPRGYVVEEAGEAVTLNLVNAEIREAAERILGEILNQSYSILDDVTGTITIQTSRSVHPSALVGILEAALASKGFVLAREKGVYIVAKQGALSRGASADGFGVSPYAGESVQAVPLRYVSAKEMARILEPLASDGAILSVDDSRNLLMLKGSGRELRHLLETVQLFDVDWLAGRSFAILPLRAANPEDIVDELEVVFETNDNGAGDGMIRFMPLKRMNAVMVISPQSEFVEEARYWVEQLDQAQSGLKKQLFVYDVQNRPAADLAKVLNEIFDKNASARIAAAQGEVAPELSEMEGAASDETPFDVDITTQSIRGGKNGSALGLPIVDEASTASGGEGLDIDVHVDEGNNALLIMATANDFKATLPVIERLDKTPNQVLLEATIAEVTLTDDFDFGLQWFFGGGSPNRRGEASFSTAANGAINATFPGFSYLFSATDIRVALNALASLTNVKILSAPSLMVLDNQTASLKVGDEVPIATSEARDVTNNNAPIVNTISFRETGVLLKITPRVNDGGLVILDIEQEVSDASVTTTSGLSAPTISQRRIETSVAVQNGESLALGGLISETDSRGSTAVPLVSDIPLVGNLFRSVNDDKRRSELLVIITPRVVRNLHEARAVTSELKDRLTTLRPPRADDSRRLSPSPRAGQ